MPENSPSILPFRAIIPAARKLAKHNSIFNIAVLVREIKGSGASAAGSQDTDEASSDNEAPQKDAAKASSTSEEASL